jgi:hypothetical protein
LPGAGDEVIFVDIVRSLGRDRDAVRKALAMLREVAGGDFAGLDEAKAEEAAMTLLGCGDPVVTALGCVVLQCYYRDDRVMRALGREPRPPFPKDHVLKQGDWSLLDRVRGRPTMWRDVAAREGDMAAEASPNAARPTDEIVDVLELGGSYPVALFEA